MSTPVLTHVHIATTTYDGMKDCTFLCLRPQTYEALLSYMSTECAWKLQIWTASG